MPRDTGLLLGRLRGRNDGPRGLLLLSAKHLQNLLRCLRSGVGLVRVQWLLLALGICAGHVGLSRLGLGLLVGAVVGVFLIVIFAIVAFGIRRLSHPSNPRLSIPRLRDNDLPVERLRRGNAVRR